MPRIIYPSNYESVSGPLIFTAGPIRGCHDWQAEAIAHIHKRRSDITIACPRHGADVVSGQYAEKLRDGQLEDQARWERHHLMLIAEGRVPGVVLFWLGPEEHHICERGFAQTTRTEYGGLVTRKGLGQKFHLVIGITPGKPPDPHYPGGRYAREYAAMEISPDFPIYDSLEATCDAALALLAR